MAKSIEENNNRQSLETIMENVKRLGRDDVWQKAFRRLCVLAGNDQLDPLYQDFYKTLAAYEQLLTEKNGRTTKAARTRQKLKNKGVVQCLEDWALEAKPTDGFNLLIGKGLADLTGEYIVLRHPDRFSKQVLHAAKERLQALNVALPPEYD